MIATFSPCGESSPSRNARPSMGRTPRTLNVFAVIHDPSKRSAFSSPLTKIVPEVEAARSLSECCDFLKSK